MDAVPYDFVVSLMRLKLSNIWIDGLEDCELLGANYGTIATEVAQKLLGCVIYVPSILSRDSFDSKVLNYDRYSKALSFVKVLAKREIEVSSLSEVSLNDLYRVSVLADYLVQDPSAVEENERSVRRLHSLMHKCRFAAIRQLKLRRFQPICFDWTIERFFTAPGVTFFFNRAVLQYHECASFKKLLLMFVDGMKLESLFLERGEKFIVPEWVQDALANLFFQPQFSNLELLDCCADGFVDRLVARWLKRPKTVPRSSRSISFEFRYRVQYKDVLSRYAFRTIGSRKYGRTHPASTRYFDCAHPKEVERRLIAKMYAWNGKESDFDIDFCEKATDMRLTFAFNEGEMARYLKELKGSFLTMKWKGRMTLLSSKLPSLVFPCFCLIFVVFIFYLVYLSEPKGRKYHSP
uniref:UPF0481 protein At3g47200-like n=1 Tax=Steinernema glaseri TaxID=37863 RepID=A0A1I7ZGA6_9BILA